MLKAKILFLAFLSAISLFVFTAPIFAGGYPIYTWTWDNPDAWRSDYKMTYARVHLDPRIPCIGTTVTFKYENPQPGDSVNPSTYIFNEVGNKYSKYNGTNIPDCSTYAKFFSTNNNLKTGIAEFKTAEGNTYKATFALNFDQSSPGNIDDREKYPLPWEEDYIKFNSTPSPTASSNIPMPGAPEMVYPVDGQRLDLEGAYMFKVNPVEGSTGYLFGLFQDGQMIYENYRDTRALSANGEFALWESNPFHAKFHEGPVQVWIRAYVRNQWTDARIITIDLKPRAGGARVTQIVSTPQPNVQRVTSTRVSTTTPPAFQPNQQIVVVTDSSASAALQRQIDELQQKLEASQRRQEDTEQRQSVLELKFEQIINWVKSLFPLFR